MRMDHLFLFWELLGTVAFAASGALTGLKKNGYGIIKWTLRKENLVKGDLLYDQKKLRQRI